MTRRSFIGGLFSVPVLGFSFWNAKQGASTKARISPREKLLMEAAVPGSRLVETEKGYYWERGKGEERETLGFAWGVPIERGTEKACRSFAKATWQPIINGYVELLNKVTIDAAFPPVGAA